MFVLVRLSCHFLAALYSPAGIGMTSWLSCVRGFLFSCHFPKESPHCNSVLGDISIKNELRIPLKRGLIVLSTGKACICLSHPRKLKNSVLFCSIYNFVQCYSVLSDLHSMVIYVT